MIKMRIAVVLLMIVMNFNAAYKSNHEELDKLNNVIGRYNTWLSVYTFLFQESNKCWLFRYENIKQEEDDSYKSLKIIFFYLEGALEKIDNEQLMQLDIVPLKINLIRIALEHADSDFIKEIMNKDNRWINQLKVRCINDILFGESLCFSSLTNIRSIQESFESLIGGIKDSCRLYPSYLHATLLIYIDDLREMRKRELQKYIVKMGNF